MISIIIPVYNVEKFIRQCLDSILSQSYKNYEVILIDDKSKDSSLDIIREYEKKYSIPAKGGPQFIIHQSVQTQCLRQKRCCC